MTRQKKEIIKKIEAIDNFIEIDRQLGCGFEPEGAYSELEQESDRLFEELAKLSHYKNSYEMMHDERRYIGQR